MYHTQLIDIRKCICNVHVYGGKISTHRKFKVHCKEHSVVICNRLNTRFDSYMDSVAGFTPLASSLIMISVRYWENYIDRDMCSFQIQTIKNNLRIGRCKTYIFASLWKIGLTLAFAYILIPDMTPLAHLFRHVGNESAFDNSSLQYVDYGSDQQDYFFPNQNYTNFATNDIDYIPG